MSGNLSPPTNFSAARAPGSDLPIEAALPELLAALDARPNAVLVAPPGAGKTTRVPLALMSADWRGDGRIVILEPRRLAARASADRMADLLGEKVGQTVGLRVRLQSLVSDKTRVEVVTEGVFVRMILEDPSLEGVSAVLFDEFHERSLDADLGLALALDAQAALRPDLRLLVMSATLDGARVAALLRDATVVQSEGRAYPVETIYLGRDPRERMEDAVLRAVLRALSEQTGSILVFLPGQGEILRLAAVLEEKLRGKPIDVAPLYGSMDRAAQDRAVRPAAQGLRKIVLATSIAETSITIQGVRVVIDSGLARAPRFEPDIGLSRLETVRVSRASADQRRGRAGRTEPGHCYRLWEEAANGSLTPFSPPEILAADLSGLLLDLAAWGARNPTDLNWLDPPPGPALIEARALLVELGALNITGALSQEGRAIRALALPPRLARMTLDAARLGAAEKAGALAALLVERGLGGDSVDLAERFERFSRDSSARAKDARRLAAAWARQARHGAGVVGAERHQGDALSVGEILCLAYPDRIAKARGKPGEFLMANGRAAALEPHSHLARAPFLAIAEVTGRAGASRILAAAALTPEEVATIAGDRIVETTQTFFDSQACALRARAFARLGAIVLSERNLRTPTDGEAARLLAEGLMKLGPERLGWTKARQQWRDRVLFLRKAHGGGSDDFNSTESLSDNPWPDVSDAGLRADGGRWLAPFIEGRAGLADIAASDLDAALSAMLTWDQQRKLDVEAPTHFSTPAGSSIALDYQAANGPALAVRVQELFGLRTHPTLAGGRAPITLHLLSPAQRPIQITRDLPGFWKGSWSAVKAEMRGQYPRHVWPDDPAEAAPTARAKPRGA